MDKELQAALAAIISKTLNAVDAGTAFLQGQLPDVILQLLRWKMIESLSCFCFSAAAAAFSFYLVYRLARKDDADNGGPIVFMALLGLICIGFTVHYTDWLQILVAPKVYLLEYTAHLVTK